MMVGGGSTGQRLPLADVVVLDLSRMLPGAVLARQLLDLGARVLKVEEPESGDPLRHVPPLAGGVGAAWASLLRGAESLALDLREPADAAVVRRLARRADVVVESFRPGTLAAWGLGEERLRASNPGLVWCSLSAFGPASPGRIGHDLNFTALTGALEELGGGVPGLQLADVGAALLAMTAVLAALLERRRSGRGARLDQPLVSGPLPFVAWAWADAGAGGGGVGDVLLGGRVPAYRTYQCADGRLLAVGALEPKLWLELVAMLELPEVAGAGLESGGEGLRAAAAVAGRFATRPRAEWLEEAAARGLPVTAVHRPAEALDEPLAAAAGLVESTPLPDGGALRGAGPFVPSLGRTPAAPAPRLDQHRAAVVAELLGEEPAP